MLADTDRARDALQSILRILLTVTACSGDRDRFAAVWRCAVKL